MSLMEFTSGAEVIANVKRTRAIFFPPLPSRVISKVPATTTKAETITDDQYTELYVREPEQPKQPDIPAAIQNSMHNIIRAVSVFYAVPVNALLSQRRYKPHVHARHVVMYLAKTLTSRSYPDIGRRLGGMDHTTVLNGVQKITRLRPSDPKLDADLRSLEAQLAG